MEARTGLARHRLRRPDDLGRLRRLRAERRLARAETLLEDGAEGLSVQALSSLSALLEARDRYTSGHSQRVTRHAERIAKAMGLSPAEVAKVRTAAALHDVGKLHTPREILNKPDRLTDEEFAVIKRHPGDGAAMAQARLPDHHGHHPPPPRAARRQRLPRRPRRRGDPARRSHHRRRRHLRRDDLQPRVPPSRAATSTRSTCCARRPAPSSTATRSPPSRATTAAPYRRLVGVRHRRPAAPLRLARRRLPRHRRGRRGRRRARHRARRPAASHHHPRRCGAPARGRARSNGRHAPVERTPRSTRRAAPPPPAGERRATRREAERVARKAFAPPPSEAPQEDAAP